MVDEKCPEQCPSCKEGSVPAELPDFAMSCRNCGAEFIVKSCYEEIDGEICPECGSSNLEERYISFPLDGPGFQEGYSTESLVDSCNQMTEDSFVFEK